MGRFILWLLDGTQMVGDATFYTQYIPQMDSFKISLERKMHFPKHTFKTL